MRQSSKTISTSQKDIRALAGDHFVNVPMKVTKASVTASLVNGVLEAGTLISAAGATVVTTAAGENTPATTTAYGIVYADVDFNNSKGTEVVPVMIHGFVKTSAIKLNATSSLAAVEKNALNMISFL